MHVEMGESIVQSIQTQNFVVLWFFSFRVLFQNTYSHYRGPDCEHLCTKHAKAKGTWPCRSPWVECTKEGLDKESHYRGPEAENLCAKHTGSASKRTKHFPRPCVDCPCVD